MDNIFVEKLIYIESCVQNKFDRESRKMTGHG